MKFFTEDFILRERYFILTSYFSKLNANIELLNESKRGFLPICRKRKFDEH